VAEPVEIAGGEDRDAWIDRRDKRGCRRRSRAVVRHDQDVGSERPRIDAQQMRFARRFHVTCQ
jgi:hypothetical protein